MCSLDVFLVLVVYSAAIDGKALTTGYEHYSEVQGWLKLHRSPATWRNARLTCFSEGAVLASPENIALMAAMNNIMSSDSGLSNVFTGIHDTFSTGLFHSLEGTPLKEMPATWAPGKPDLDITERCLSMNDGMLIDKNCSDYLPFICYKQDKTPIFASCGPADNGYTYSEITDSCYKFHAEDEYWRNAFAACDEENAHLAIINSDQEAEVLKKLFIDNYYNYHRKLNDVRDVVHIGFVDWGKDGGQWMTIHGETLEEAGYANWYAGEPNNKTDQFCGGFNVDGGLDDVNCYDGDPNQATRSFICEKKPELTESFSNAYLFESFSSNE